MNQHNPASEILRGASQLRRPSAMVLFAWFCAAITSCGGKANYGNASDGNTAAAACPASDSPPETAPPASADCTEFVDGMWRKAACDGELGLSNPQISPVRVSLSLRFSPLDQVPSLTGMPDVELHVSDPSGSWYHAWSLQAGSGTLFSATNSAGMTNVRLGTSSVGLGEVELASCEARTTTGSVVAPYGEALYFDMEASLSDSAGHLISTITGQAYQLAAHPTAQDVDAGASDAGPPR